MISEILADSQNKNDNKNTPPKNDRKISDFLGHFWSRDFGTELCLK